MKINNEVLSEFERVISQYFYNYRIQIHYFRRNHKYYVSCDGMNSADDYMAEEIGYALVKAGKLVHSLNRVNMSSSYKYWDRETDMYTGDKDMDLDKINDDLYSILSSDSDTFTAEIISYLKEWEE